MITDQARLNAREACVCSDYCKCIDRAFDAGVAFAKAAESARPKVSEGDEEVAQRLLIPCGHSGGILLGSCKKCIAQAIADKGAKAQERIEELEKALRDLVSLKDWKDEEGMTPEYLRRQPVAWESARKALRKGSP